MAERFIGRIGNIANQPGSGSAAELEVTLRNYIKIYNHNIPQRALKHQTRIQALKEWKDRDGQTNGHGLAWTSSDLLTLKNDGCYIRQ
jgi:hypothetical protein